MRSPLSINRIWRRIFGWQEGDKVSWLEGVPTSIRRRYGTIFRLEHHGKTDIALLKSDPIRKRHPNGDYSVIYFMNLMEVPVSRLEEWGVGRRDRHTEQGSKR